ncbi:hypothetical protein B0A49_01437 [Cryomyces minteri]|uniref:Uncharacterized protein n=1 Tax=Cryomyces minteri TaxID=331657 RepID=A0A4U0XU95_9PEZI|nr:hypothetical protein B0A49_01437 [Cryomyces minteri]
MSSAVGGNPLKAGAGVAERVDLVNAVTGVASVTAAASGRATNVGMVADTAAAATVDDELLATAELFEDDGVIGAAVAELVAFELDPAMSEPVVVDVVKVGPEVRSADAASELLESDEVVAELLEVVELLGVVAMSDVNIPAEVPRAAAVVELLNVVEPLDELEVVALLDVLPVPDV